MRINTIIFCSLILLLISACQQESTAPNGDTSLEISSANPTKFDPPVDPVRQFTIYVRPETHSFFLVDKDHVPVWGQKIPALIIDFDHSASRPGKVSIRSGEISPSHMQLLLQSHLDGLENLLDNHGEIAYRFSPLF